MKSKYIIQKEKDLEQVIVHLQPKLTPNSVWLLEGDLGAGKTTFVKHVVKKMSPTAHVTSPTFTLINQYNTTPKVIHADLYRIGSEEEFLALDFDRYMDKGSLVFIEWPQIIPSNYFGISNRLRFEYFENGRALFID